MSNSIDIKTPKKSAKLAEFVGIMIGDGGITDYQITVTLHRVDDENYSLFVEKLLKELFQVKPNKNYRQSVVNIRISRKKLVHYCQSIGLFQGNKIKNKVDIPDWVKNNKKYLIACLRGLFDTDGSVYIHRYMSKQKQYNYTNFCFTSRSLPLLLSVKSALQRFGFNPVYGSRSDIKLYSKQDIINYYTKIGSHNSKHLDKY